MNVIRKQIWSVRYWDNWFTRTTPRVTNQVLLGVYIGRHDFLKKLLWAYY